MPFVRAADLAAIEAEAAKVEAALERVRNAERFLQAYFQTQQHPCPSGCGWRVRLTNARPMPDEYVQPADPVGLFVWSRPVAKQEVPRGTA